MVKVGQKVRFDPFQDLTFYGVADHRGSLITGEVVYVNQDHRWFSVQYGELKMRTSFCFSDIGKDVTVCPYGRR